MTIQSDSGGGEASDDHGGSVRNGGSDRGGDDDGDDDGDDVERVVVGGTPPPPPAASSADNGGRPPVANNAAGRGDGDEDDDDDDDDDEEAVVDIDIDDGDGDHPSSSSSSSSSSVPARSSPPRRRRLSPPPLPPPPEDGDDDGDDYEYASALSRALKAMGSSAATSSSSSSSTTTSTTTATATMMDLLREGACRILAAGRGAGARDDRVAFLPASTASVAAAAAHPPGAGASFRGGGRRATNAANATAIVGPDEAGLYLRAVAASVAPLGDAVAASPSSSSSSWSSSSGLRGGAGVAVAASSGGDGDFEGSAAEQVVEIVAAAGVAASFAGSRAAVARSGIVQALSRLIEISTGGCGEVVAARRGSDNALTPLHADFLRVCLLAGQYRRAASFLSSRPTHRAVLDPARMRLAADDPASSCLRAHYYAGLVHAGCEAWDDALDSFHACLVLPCSSVGPIVVAARKKGLLVRCLLLEFEELDGRGGGGAAAAAAADGGAAAPRADDGGGGSGGRTAGSTLEGRVLGLPGASAAVVKFMSASSNRVGGTESAARGGAASSSPAPERTAGSETSERSSRRRTRGANPDHRASPSLPGVGAGGGGERWGRPADASPSTTTTSKVDSHLGGYHDLVSAYIKGNASHYARLLTEITDLLHSDGNWELAKRLEGRLLVYRTIRRVASVYSVVGADVLEGKMQEVGAGEVGMRGIEDLLMGMAGHDAGDPLLADPFVARADQSTGMVSFLDDVDDDESVEDHGERLDADLSDRLRSCIALAERVRDLDIALTTSPKYQQHAMKEMMMKGDRFANTKPQGSSVADIGHGPMDIGADW